MKTMTRRCAAGSLAGWLFSFIAGCAAAPAHHDMTPGRDGVTIACGKCYDVIRKSRHARGAATARTVHACPDCKSEMAVYDENGVAMARCERCAPDGIPCDKCLPPKSDGR